ncbi:MFS transporter [Tuberibacillus calidus]|uniref:MFS transporter n=1 Tax=Tuberibacillus calidus TaxID=340097 RepID=UPI003CCB8F8E
MPSSLVLYVFVVFFTLGEIIILPVINDLVAEIAPSQYLSTYYGFVDIGWALGATFGNLIGGILYDFLIHTGVVWINWSIYTGIAIVSILLVSSLLMNPKQKRTRSI